MSYKKIEFNARDIRALIAFSYKKNMSAKDTTDEINSVLGLNTVSLATVYRWFQNFRFGRTSLDDDPKSGRPWR